MPSVALHLHLAERIRLETRTGREVARDSRPADVNAFRMGALGPDLGYVPGGHRPLSDLAHCLHSADLCRALIMAARTTEEAAFAAGWMSHLLADLLIHPLVGRAVARLVGGDDRQFVDGDQAPAPHVQVEAGLDVFYVRRHPEVVGIRLTPVFEEPSIGFLAGAFATTYGVDPPRSKILRSHRLTARRGVQALWLARVLRRTRSSAELAGPVRRSVSRRWVAAAYLTPALPSPWLATAVGAAEGELLRRFDAEWPRRGSGLGNFNLDTGRPDLLETEHGGLRRTVAYLSRFGRASDVYATPIHEA